MTRTLAPIGLLALAAAATACSTSHSMSDGGGPGGDAEPPRDGDMPPPDDGGTEDTGPPPPPPPPPECEVDTDAEGPFETRLRFVNDGFEELWLNTSCELQYTISSCASDYEEIAIRPGCTVDCEEGAGTCIACAPCMTRGIPLEPSGGETDDRWGGMIYTFGETPSGCPCHDGRVAPPGRYRVTIPVYASEEDARSGDVLREVTHEFQLPAADGLVVVLLGPE